MATSKRNTKGRAGPWAAARCSDIDPRVYTVSGTSSGAVRINRLRKLSLLEILRTTHATNDDNRGPQIVAMTREVQSHKLSGGDRNALG